MKDRYLAINACPLGIKEGKKIKEKGEGFVCECKYKKCEINVKPK